MGDIFISYAREDAVAAAKLAEALEGQSISVWWDPDIPPGEVWDALIERNLAAARAVVVLWSGASVTSSWVRAEAAEAFERGILVPVLLDDVRPPLAFRQIQAARLSDWRGDPEHCGFQHLLRTIWGLLASVTPRGTTQVVSPVRVDVQKLAKGHRFSKIVGTSVVDQNAQKVGTINDLIVDELSERIPFAILSVGGFPGVSEYLVAVSFDSLRISPGRIELRDVTKDELEALPEFRYAQE